MGEQTKPQTQPILDTIPPPKAIRDRLSDVLHEAEVLRRLLRLSQREAKRQREGTGNET